MKVDNLNRGMTILIVALLLWGAVVVLQAWATSSVEKVYVDPYLSEFESGKAELNGTFQVTIKIENFIEVHGWQIQLYFNSTLLEVIKVTIPSIYDDRYIFFNEDVSPQMIEKPPGSNYVKMGQNLTGNNWVTNTQSKILATVIFRRIKLPPKPPEPSVESKVSSVLNINNPGTVLLDPSGNPLPGSEWKIDGKYEYKWSAPGEKPYLTVDPAEKKYKRDPPTSVGKQFDIAVKIWRLDVNPLKGIVNPLGSNELVNISFTLIYDHTLLQVINITQGSFMRKFGDVTFTSNIDTPGKAVVNQVYLNPPWRTFPYGHGDDVAKIWFNVTYQGRYPVINQSILNLTDITLKDRYGNDIPIDTTKIINGTCIIEGLLEPELKIIDLQTGASIFRFFTNSTGLGSRFNVTVVARVGDLFYYQVYLTYNATLLNATRAWLPKWDNTSLPWVFYGKATNLPQPKFYPGAVKIGDAMINTDPPQPTFTGTGKLAIIEFQILATVPKFGNVSSVLNITNADTFLYDSEDHLIPAPPTNGYFEYIWAEKLPSLELKPSVYTAVEPETFKVTVWINDVDAEKGLVSLEFKLRYDASLLSPVQVIDGPFLARFDFTFDYFFNVGNVAIKHYMNPPYANFPYGSGPIVTITFQGIYQDSKENNCTLEFVDILLKDENGTEISTAPQINGFYTILPIGSSILTINVNPIYAEIESDIAISGTLKPIRPNVNITIHYRVSNGTWTTLATIKTDAYSNYTFIWTPTKEGIYEIQASWPGDENTNPAESSIKTVTIWAKPATIDFALYVAIGAGITVLIAIAVYFLKIRKH